MEEHALLCRVYTVETIFERNAVSPLSPNHTDSTLQRKSVKTLNYANSP